MNKEFIKEIIHSIGPQMLAATLIIIFSIMFCFGVNKYKNENIKLKEELQYYKNLTAPFENLQDSIKHSIAERDSMVIKIKYNYETKKLEVADMDDNSIIDEFNNLVWAN